MADKKPYVNCALPEDTFRKLKAFADKRGHTLRWVLAQAVESYVKAAK